MVSYGEDLSYIHDAGFSGFSLNSATGLLALLRRSGVDRGLVVDLGCGSGVWARQLGFAGYDVLGVDASPHMIRLARRTAPKARFIVDSLAHASLPRCDAVTSIGECVSYAFAGDVQNRELLKLFRKVRRALRPGGVLILDFAKRGREPAGMPRKSYWTGDDWAVLVEQVVARGLLTRSLTSFRKAGRIYRRSEEVHRLRLYGVDEVREVLETAGFEVSALRGYGKVRFRSGHAGLLARAL